jgi:hypothetical protein
MSDVKNKGPGQPRKFQTVEELEERIQAYWDYCDDNEKPVTMSGLAFFIGCDRRTLTNYANSDLFFPTIKKARDRVEFCNEELLLSGKATAGVIFSLKNNYRWTDKALETESEGEGSNDVSINVNLVVDNGPE